MKNLKEKQLLVNLAKSLGQRADEEIVKELREFDRIKIEAKKSVRKDPLSYIAEAAAKIENQSKQDTPAYPLPPSLDELQEMLKDVPELAPEEPVQVKEEEQSLIEQTAQFISEAPKESFQQPDPPLVDKNLDAIQKKLKFLEQAIGKIAAHGPGGGAGDVINLTFPVKLISSNYTITRRDYYIGVNSPSTVNIVLPDGIGFPGRKVVIKDESGNCENNPIVVFGTVDNDAGGFILAQNNGAIQMIYREGWRII